jgi:pimeloyl-ACP methyl ester carboxylesterase
MTHRNVEILIGKLATDPSLIRRFVSDRAALLADLQRQGFELTDVEIDALSSTDVEAIKTITRALDRRIRKASGVAPTPEEKENPMNAPTSHYDLPPSSSSRGERRIEANGVELCAEAFGDAAHPTLILPQGACYSMLRYPEEECRLLAAAGLQVIRYDNRDSGRSTCYPPGQPGYTLQDMAKDAIAILDGYGVERAHFLGASQGGMIAQIAAYQDPRRVASITLMMSTPDSSSTLSAGSADPSADALPPPTAPTLEMMRFLATVDWSSQEQVIAALLVEARVLAGSRFPRRDDEVRAYALAEIRRARNLRSSRFNHGLAQQQSPRWRPRLDEIQAPTLVIHGTEDPILPLGHGVALAKEIRGAELLVVDGMGHDATAATWDLLRPAVLRHVFGGVRGAQA